MHKTTSIAAGFALLLASTALAQTGGGGAGGGATGGPGAGGAGAIAPSGRGATGGFGAGGAGALTPGGGGATTTTPGTSTQDTTTAPSSTPVAPSTRTVTPGTTSTTPGVATVPQPAPTPAPGVTIIAPGAEPAPLILRGGGSRGGAIHNPDPGQSTDSAAGTTTAPGAAPTSSMIGNAPAGSTAPDIDSSNIHWRAIAQNWKAETGEVRRRWSLLTPADVEAVGGIRANLVRTLQQRYGISAAQADLEVETFERR